MKVIYKQYYVCSTDYKVKARDLSTSSERIYDAKRFQVVMKATPKIFSKNAMKLFVSREGIL